MSVDVIDIVVLVLRLALVGLIYLFIVLVMRQATRGLRVAEPERPVQLRLPVEEPGDSGLVQGREIAVPSGATLGRTDRALVVVADPAVSAEHARLVSRGTRWLVADLGSTNGTLVNQRRIRGETPLAPGDVLGLGNVRLRVVGTMTASDG